MTTYEFEVAAKNAVIHIVSNEYYEEYGIEDISVVWMAHLLGSKKAILIDNGRNRRMYEVTYNAQNDELYVDAYEKKVNRKFCNYDIGRFMNAEKSVVSKDAEQSAERERMLQR